MNKILFNKKLYIFDMDGTVYLGSRVFPFAVDFIKKLRENNRRVLFFTNNASKSADFYRDRLNSMGFEVRRGEVLTSGDVCARYLLAHRPGKRVYPVSTPLLRQSFASYGIPLADDGEDADIVVSSFDTTLTYDKLSHACSLIRGGAEFLSTHPDFNCPTENGFIPDSGAICAAISASTGVQPVYFGKPHSHTAKMICELSGTEPEDMCIFGDRLYTDIALGKRFGITAVLVLTGEATADDNDDADAAERADFVYPSLKEVCEDLFG